MISGNVPSHLLVAARSGFLTSVRSQALVWGRLAEVINMDAKSVDLVDLGDAPMPVENIGKSQVQEMIEKTLNIKPRNWSITVSISHNAIMDDQTGSLDRKARGAGVNFGKHIQKLVFEKLNAGDVAGNVGYDGLTFFNNAHIDPGAHYQTGQDNLFGLALSQDNFATVMAAAKQFRNDQGDFTDYVYDTLIVPPVLETVAAQITGNPQVYDTANREINPFSGRVGAIVNPYLDATAWVLAATSETAKPMIVSIREQPNLQSAWFDPNGGDGGMFYFKFYARYNIHYGDYRLAVMGNS